MDTKEEASERWERQSLGPRGEHACGAGLTVILLENRSLTALVCLVAQTYSISLSTRPSCPELALAMTLTLAVVQTHLHQPGPECLGCISRKSESIPSSSSHKKN